MSRLRKLLMGLLVSSLCLLAMEGAARVLTGPPTPPFVATIPAPGESGQWLKRGQDGRIEATYQNRFVIPPFPAEPGDGPRVIWVGGSSVRGGRGDSKPEREMPGLTAARVEGVEMLNLGAPGLDTRHLWAMAPELLALQPDVLVIYTGHNDLGNVLFEGSVPTASAARAMRVRAILRRARLFELMERGEETVSGLRVGEENGANARERLGDMEPVQREAMLGDFERRLRWLVRAARQQGVQVVLVTVISDARSPSAQWSCPELMEQVGLGAKPGRASGPRVDEQLLADSDCRDARWYVAHNTLKNGLPREHPEAVETLLELRDTDPWATRAGRPSNEIIRSVAREEGAVLVDMAAVAQERGQGLEPVRWFTDPIHLSPGGHRAIADQVTPVLAQLLDLPFLPAQAPGEAPPERPDGAPTPPPPGHTPGTPIHHPGVKFAGPKGPPPPGGAPKPPPGEQLQPPPGEQLQPPPGPR